MYASVQSILVYSNPTDAGLNRHKQELPPSDFRIYDPDLSPTIPSGILHFSLVAPPGFILNHSIH
jgi:hypothetical protein